MPSNIQRRSHPTGSIAKPLNSDRASTVLSVTALWAIDPDKDVTQDWDKVTSRLLGFLLERVKRQIKLRHCPSQRRRSPLLLGQVMTMLVTGEGESDEHFAANELAVLSGLQAILQDLIRQEGDAADIEQLRKVTSLLRMTDHILMAFTSSSIPGWRFDPLTISREELYHVCTALQTGQQVRCIAA